MTPPIRDRVCVLVHLRPTRLPFLLVDEMDKRASLSQRSDPPPDGYRAVGEWVELETPPGVGVQVFLWEGSGDPPGKNEAYPLQRAQEQIPHGEAIVQSAWQAVFDLLDCGGEETLRPILAYIEKLPGIGSN